MSGKKMYRFFWYFGVFLLIGFFIFASQYEYIRSYLYTPPGTRYFGATGFVLDYYQYLSWIRDGSYGSIFISSRYIPSYEKPVLLYAFFPTLGFVTGFIKLPPHFIFRAAELILLPIWIFTIYFLTRHTFYEKKQMRAAFLLTMVATSFPSVSFKSGRVEFLPHIPFWKNFYLLEKFAVYPHHLLANILFIVMLILLFESLRQRRISKKKTGMIFVFSIVHFLSNTASMVFFLVTLGVFLGGSIVLEFRSPPPTLKLRRASKLLGWYVGVSGLAVLPFVLYYKYLFANVDPWRWYYYGEKVGRYLVTFPTYLGSLGPLLITGVLSLLLIRRFSFQFVLLALWAFLPVIMFPFAGKQIPFAMSRILGLNTFIPLSFLTIFFISKLPPTSPPAGGFRGASRSLKLLRSLKIIEVIFLFVSLGLGGIVSVKSVFSYTPGNYYNVYLPEELLSALSYIQTNLRKHGVVLAGDTISSLTPALTDAHVVLGRLDAYPNYPQVLTAVNDIYQRRIGNEELLDQLGKWNVQFLIFGIDQVSYEEFTKKGEVKGVKPAFRSGNVVVGEVVYSSTSPPAGGRYGLPAGRQGFRTIL